MRDAFALVGLAVSLGGCFIAHQRSSGEVDAAETRDAAAIRDAADLDSSSRPDGGSDAAACRTVGSSHPVRACVLTATGAIPSGEVYRLPLGYSRCECPGSRRCEVAIDGDRVLLTTSSCDDPLACDECEFEVECELPALAPGRYFVHVDGVRVMQVEAAPRVTPPVARPVCAPVPDSPDESLLCDLDARPAPPVPLTVCRPAIEDVGRNVPISIEACVGCFDASAGCETRLEDARLVLTPHLYRCACPTCGACAPECVPITLRCQSPPLAAGTYGLLVETEGGLQDAGSLEIRDVFDPGPPLCTEVR